MREFILAFGRVLAMMAPWLLGGFLLSGIVAVFLPREWVVKVMGKARGWRGILNAVLIGVPLPICSCGVLPLTAGLRKAGAGKGASAGFLISTPQTGIDSILATYALMGPVFAVARPLAAFATGIVGGVAVDLIAEEESHVPEEDHHHGCCCCHGKGESHDAHHPHDEAEEKGNLLVQVFKKAYGELLGEIVRPLVVGLLIAAVVTVLVPENFFATAFGDNDWLAMPAMVLLGFPMYVCSTASIPIAASLVMKGLTPGAAFVFLMVGPAINAASMATVSQLVGRRAAVVYALVISLGALLMGVLINCLPFDVLPKMADCCAEDGVSVGEWIAAGVLLLLILFHLLPKREHGCCCCHEEEEDEDYCGGEHA